jgi:hypothetical protein
MADKTKSMVSAKIDGKVDLKDAVKSAAGYFVELYPNFSGANIALEEVEESEDGSFWLITLGYDVTLKPTMAGSLANMFPGSSTARRYKLFKIETKTGRVVSMKIRKID